MSRPKSVLIVDDDQDGCALLAEFLRSRGYHVIEAWDGLDGLEQLHARRGRVDAIILDLEMPNIDGPSFRVQQTHYPALRDVPIIVSSGHPNAKEIASDLEAVAVMHKPVVPSAMLATLAKAIASHAPPTGGD